MAFLFIEGLKRFKIIKIDIKNKNIVPLLFLSLLQPLIYCTFEAIGIALTSSSQASIMVAFNVVELFKRLVSGNLLMYFVLLTDLRMLSATAFWRYLLQCWHSSH